MSNFLNVDVAWKKSICVWTYQTVTFFWEKNVSYFLFFLQITRRAFQRTYSELLAHLELGNNLLQSWQKISYDLGGYCKGLNLNPCSSRPEHRKIFSQLWASLSPSSRWARSSEYVRWKALSVICKKNKTLSNVFLSEKSYSLISPHTNRLFFMRHPLQDPLQDQLQVLRANCKCSNPCGKCSGPTARSTKFILRFLSCRERQELIHDTSSWTYFLKFWSLKR